MRALGETIGMILGKNLFPLISCLLIVYMAWDGNRDRQRLFEQREKQMQLLLKAAESDRTAAIQQRIMIEKLTTRTETIVDALQDPDAVCLGPGDTDRLRSLWD